MTYRFLLLVSLIALLNTLAAQESVYNFSQYTIPLADAVLYNKKVYCGIYKQTSGESLDSITSSILVFNQNGILEREIMVDSIQSLPLVVPTCLRPGDGENEFYIAFQSNPGHMGQSSETELRLVDSTLNTISSLKFPVDSGLFIISSFYKRSDTTVLAGSFEAHYGQPAIMVFKGSQLIRDLRYKHLDASSFMSVNYFNGHYVFGFLGPRNEYLLTFDQSFINDSIFERGKSSDWRIRQFYDFIGVPNGKYLYGLGIYNVQSFAVIKFNQNFQRVRIDTLLSEWSHSPSSTGYLENSINSMGVNCDYHTPDSIFMIGGMPFNNGVNWLLGDSVKAPLQVVLADTAGNFHWSRTVGDGDSAYYYAMTVVATDDGGALIFSSKYDHTHSIEPHYLLSVIKIQGNGEVISENEYSLARGKALTLFPNPVASRVNFQLPSDMQAVAFRIFCQSSSLVASGGIEGELDFIKVNDLSAGIYILEITDVEGQKYLGRFLKS